jgi:hypothetical protein
MPVVGFSCRVTWWVKDGKPVSLTRRLRAVGLQTWMRHSTLRRWWLLVKNPKPISPLRYRLRLLSELHSEVPELNRLEVPFTWPFDQGMEGDETAKSCRMSGARTSEAWILQLRPQTVADARCDGPSPNVCPLNDRHQWYTGHRSGQWQIIPGYQPARIGEVPGSK